jgi:hypothetical protein
MTFPADPLYQNLLLSAEKKFWRRVRSDETAHLVGPNRRGLAGGRGWST